MLLYLCNLWYKNARSLFGSPRIFSDHLAVRLVTWILIFERFFIYSRICQLHWEIYQIPNFIFPIRWYLQSTTPDFQVYFLFDKGKQHLPNVHHHLFHFPFRMFSLVMDTNINKIPYFLWLCQWVKNSFFLHIKSNQSHRLNRSVIQSISWNMDPKKSFFCNKEYGVLSLLLYIFTLAAHLHSDPIMDQASYTIRNVLTKPKRFFHLISIEIENANENWNSKSETNRVKYFGSDNWIMVRC